MNTNASRALARGAAWMISFRMLDRLLGLASMLILARVLAPSDFGLVAMATAAIALVELFGAFGLDVALIQRPATARGHYDSAWTLNALIGLSVAGVLLALATPLAQFYNEPRLFFVIAFLAMGPAIQGFENVGVVAFRKELDFGREFRFLLTKWILTFIVVVPLALSLRSYWALAIGMVFGRCAGVAVSYLLHPFRPRWSLAHARDLLHFSGWLVAQNLVAFMKDRAPDFIVGKFAGAHSLGLFNIANELSSLVGTELISPMNRAALPMYSKLASDPQSLAREYLAVASIVTLLVTPLVAGLAALAPLVVTALLGAKWHAAAGLIQWLAFLGLTNVFLGTSHAPILALGQPALFVKIHAFQVALGVPLSLWLTHAYGVEGAVTAAVVTGIRLLPVNITLVVRSLGISALQLLGRSWRPLLGAGIMYLSIGLLMPADGLSEFMLARAAAYLAFFVPFGAAVYFVSVLALWLLAGRPTGAESTVLAHLSQLGRNVAARVASL